MTILVPVHLSPSGAVGEQLLAYADRPKKARKADQHPKEDAETETDEAGRALANGGRLLNQHDTSLPRS